VEGYPGKSINLCLHRRSAPGAWRRSKDTSLRVEKRLRPVVPLGRNRVGPLPRNRVVPFKRNQVGPITRNPALPPSDPDDRNNATLAATRLPRAQQINNLDDFTMKGFCEQIHERHEERS